MKKLTGFFAFCLVLSSIYQLLPPAACLAQESKPVPSSLPRDEAWRQDVQFLAKELPKRHKNLFFHLKKADFNRSIRQLDTTLPKLSDGQ
ncbi:MAG TPA: hypothetical protein PLU80_00460, partial [Acidobacteriota bacterium]|nr:hypothetical protein [Acidobacteriota bacterium]